MKYEVRQIDAWNNGDGWTWNNSFHLFDFNTNAKDHKIAFTNIMRNTGLLKLNRGTYYVDYDGSVYEIRLKKTDEPLFAAIPKE